MSAERIDVTATSPKSWESDASFSETLDEWMRGTPWLMVSLAAHLLLFFLFATIPWEHLKAPPRDDSFAFAPEEPPEEFAPPEPYEPELPLEPLPSEPQPVSEPDFTESSSESRSSLESSPDSTPRLTASAPNAADFPAAIGLGGGSPAGGGKSGGREDRRRGASPPLVRDATRWLVAHQAEDGSWDADGFSERCGELGSTLCDGAGSPVHDVGVTGLALLALLGDGHTPEHGEYRSQVSRGLAWLTESQDPDSGQVGERASHEFLYDHAIATLALCEGYYFTKSPLRRRPAQKAVHFVQRARNPYGAWRYEVPPNGESDTSVTGWMVLALSSARDAGLEVDPAALEGALAFLDDMTDPATGRVGYMERGSLSSRTLANAHFPAERGEALTGVGLLSRIFLGQTPETHPILNRHAEVLRRSLPEWAPEDGGCDMIAWYYGSYAMFQLGGEDWKAWSRALERAARESQRTSGDERGSWDPVGPWGAAGGRVYSTALMALSAEASYRYGRVLGGR